MAESYRDTDGDARVGQAPVDFNTVEGRSGEPREPRGESFGLVDGVLVLLVVLFVLSYAD